MLHGLGVVIIRGVTRERCPRDAPERPRKNTHLGYEYLRFTTGLKGQHIPYKGGAPAATALLTGEVDAAFLSTSVVTPLAKSGKAVALAISDQKRYPALPSVPTVAESGYPGFQMIFSYVLLAPGATPTPIIQLLNREVRATLEADDVVQRLAAAGIDVKVSSSEEAQDRLNTESARWEKVIKAGGMSIQ